MTGIRARVLAGLGANASGQLVTTVIQLVSVPVFLHFWSVEQYGQWLLLSALPAYLSMADLGLGTIAMNRMTILHARNRLAESRTVFQTALLLITAMSAVLFIVSGAAIWLLPLDVFQPQGARLAMTLLVLTALMNLYSSLFDAVFRSSGQFALGTYLINAGRLLEWLGGLGALLLSGSMAAVAAGFLAARLLTMLLLRQFAQHRIPAYPWRTTDASMQELQRMWRPALSYLSFPLGNALAIQGMSVVVGISLGPTALAIFNTYRTLSRLPVQMLTTFSRSLWPEISRAFGDGNRPLLRRIYRHGTTISLLLCAAACVATFLCGDRVLALWTSRSIPFHASLLAFFLLAAFANCAWLVSHVVLIATNLHERLAVVYVFAAATSIAAAISMPADWGLGGMVIAMGLFEVIVLVASHKLVSGVLGRNWQSWSGSGDSANVGSQS